MTLSQPQPYSSTRQDPAFRFLGLPTLIRSAADTTNGAFGLMEHWSMPAGFASPYHTHHREDEAFYVLEGELAFVCDGKWVAGGPGTYVFGPRELAHGFKVIGSQPARMLLLCAPAGFEQFVIELGVPFENLSPPDMGKLMAAAAKFDIDIHGPLPEYTVPERPAQELPAAQDAKALTLRWLEAFNQRDWETESALRGANFQCHLSGVPEPLDNQGWSGFMQQFTAAFPDARITVDACLSEGETAMARWTLTGVHQSLFNGIPATGRAIKFTGIECNRFAGGQVIEHWSQFDLMSLLQQLGAAAHA